MINPRFYEIVVYFDSCVDIDECANDLDECDDADRADCTNTVGSYTCACRAGLTGDGRNCVVVGDWLIPLPVTTTEAGIGRKICFEIFD